MTWQYRGIICSAVMMTLRHLLPVGIEPGSACLCSCSPLLSPPPPPPPLLASYSPLLLFGKPSIFTPYPSKIRNRGRKPARTPVHPSAAEKFAAKGRRNRIFRGRRPPKIKYFAAAGREIETSKPQAAKGRTRINLNIIKFTQKLLEITIFLRVGHVVYKLQNSYSFDP